MGPLCQFASGSRLRTSCHLRGMASVPEHSAESKPAAPAVCRRRVPVLLVHADTRLSPRHKGPLSPGQGLSRQWLVLHGSGASLQLCETPFLFPAPLCAVSSLGETCAKPLASRRWDRSAAGHQMKDPSTLGPRRLKIHPGVSCCPQSHADSLCGWQPALCPALLGWRSGWRH